MKHCQKCDKDFADNEIEFCGLCGSPLQTVDSQGKGAEEDGDLDFVVTESASAPPEFVGGNKEFEEDPEARELDNSKKVSDNRESEPKPDKQSESYTPIGQSAPILPDAYHTTEKEPDTEDGIDTAPNEVVSETPPPREVRKLSDEEVKSINETLYSSSEYLTKEEKGELLNRLSDIKKKNNVAFPGGGRSSDGSKKENSRADQQADPVPAAADNLPQPKMAPQSHGVAFYYKNFIEMQGIKNFHPGDEVTFEGRSYQLIAKKISNRWTWGAAIGLFAIVLIFIGSMFISNPVSTDGQIVGIVVNQDDSPFILGAELRLKETGKKVTSNGEGFFNFDRLSSGPYEVDCYVDGKRVGSEIATVSEGLTTTLTIKPDLKSGMAARKSKSTTPSKSREVSRAEPQETSQPTVAVEQATPEPSKEPTKPAPTKKMASSKPSGPGKLLLAANVESAKLVLDGKTLGAGNLTYSNIKPGIHKYLVSADGYLEAGGTVKVQSGEKTTLKVVLSPMTAEAKAEEYQAIDYYRSALAAYKDRDFDAAIEDFNKSIDMQPANPQAHFYRGEVLAAMNKKSEAHDDFILAAEQFQFQKKFPDAITSYNRALDIDFNSMAAHLGRGQLYLKSNETFAAVADFEAAVDIDRRNFQAQYGLGEARFQQGNYKKAIEHFKNARSIDESNPLVHQYLMLSYLAKDDYKEVRKSYEKFKEVANNEQMARFKENGKYSAILKVIETNN